MFLVLLQTRSFIFKEWPWFSTYVCNPYSGQTDNPFLEPVLPQCPKPSFCTTSAALNTSVAYCGWVPKPQKLLCLKHAEPPQTLLRTTPCPSIQEPLWRDLSWDGSYTPALTQSHQVSPSRLSNVSTLKQFNIGAITK